MEDGGNKKKSSKEPTFTYTGMPTRADSIFLLNNNKIIENLLKSGKYEWEKPGGKKKVDPKRWKQTFENSKSFFDTGIQEEMKKGKKTKGKLSDYKKVKGKMIGTSDWISGGGDDYGFPIQYIHPDIAPQFKGDLWPVKDRITNIRDTGNNPMVYSYGYDPLAIAPWDMLTSQQQKLRIKKYGTSGTPYDNSTIDQPEPTLKKKVLNVEPIKSDISIASPKVRELKKIDETPSSTKGTYNWNVEYFDPIQKKTATKTFATDKEAEQFYNNPANRASRKYSDVSSVGRFKKGGWLDKYN
jgi:hypothetical protein